LLRKELRQLLPWTALILTWTFVSIVWPWLFDSPDESVWAAATPLFEPLAAKIWNGLLLFWALLLTYAGFPRERDDQTLDFLFSLPVSRPQLFLAKFLAAGLLLSVALLIAETSRAVLQLANHTSFDGATFRTSWALVSVGLGLATAWINLGYATFLAVFRRLGLLIGLVLWTLLEVVAFERPALRVLSPLELMRVEFFYGTAVVPWKGLLGHAAVSGGLSALSAFIWVGPTERWSNAMTRFSAKLWAKWLVGLGIIGVLLGLAVWSEGSKHEKRHEFGELRESSGVEATLDTPRYRFRFHEPLRSRVVRLAASADSAHDQLVARLGAPSESERVLVNLLSHGRAHAGSATWNAIRMDLRFAYDDDTLRRTLIHETSHVVALRASDRRLDTHAMSLRFFDEGLAEALSLDLAPDPAATRARWLEAAVLRIRERVDFPLLCDFSSFVRRFGEPAIYPLGFTWVALLRSTCGEDAPRRILSTLRRPEVPSDASGDALVRAALQLAGCDASAVSSAWGRRLDELAAQRKADIERIPTLVGNLREEDDEPVLRAVLEGPPLEGAIYRIRVRARPDDAIENQATSSAELEADGHLDFWIPEGFVTNDSVDFQFVVAWQEDGTYLEHAQEWRRGTLR
jgi:hypothetical protein